MLSNKHNFLVLVEVDNRHFVVVVQNFDQLLLLDLDARIFLLKSLVQLCHSNGLALVGITDFVHEMHDF